MGISIWLVPPPGAFEPLETLITSIAKQHGSPIFQPHITLFTVPSSPSISLAEPEKLLPPKSDLPISVPIIFKRVCTGATFFQSVFIELELGHDSGVLQAMYDGAFIRNQGLVKDGGKPPYHPHLSLYYGTPSIEEKEAIVANLEKDGVIDATSSPVEVAGVQGGFDVNEIWIVRCEGPVEGWEVLHRLRLDSEESAGKGNV